MCWSFFKTYFLSMFTLNLARFYLLFLNQREFITCLLCGRYSLSTRNTNNTENVGLCLPSNCFYFFWGRQCIKWRWSLAGKDWFPSFHSRLENFKVTEGGWGRRGSHLIMSKSITCKSTISGLHILHIFAFYFLCIPSSKTLCYAMNKELDWEWKKPEFKSHSWMTMDVTWTVWSSLFS